MKASGKDAGTVFAAFYKAANAGDAAKKRAAILAEPLDAKARQSKLLAFETELGAQVLKAL